MRKESSLCARTFSLYFSRVLAPARFGKIKSHGWVSHYLVGLTSTFSRKKKTMSW